MKIDAELYCHIHSAGIGYQISNLAITHRPALMTIYAFPLHRWLSACALCLITCALPATADDHAELSSSPANLDSIISTLSHAYDVDAYLVQAVVSIESHGNPYSVSPYQATGLMLLTPSTVNAVAGHTDGQQKPLNLKDPVFNLLAGVRLLAHLNQQFEGDLHLVLAAYSAGEQAVLDHNFQVPPLPTTQRFLNAVLHRYQALTQEAR